MERFWEVLFYHDSAGDSPVKDFIRNLPKVERTRIGQGIESLEISGPSIRMPHARPITSEKGLFELRIKGEDNLYRIFYCHYTGKTFVLLHAFTKKTRKTPEKEIHIAKQRRTQFLKTMENA